MHSIDLPLCSGLRRIALLAPMAAIASIALSPLVMPAKMGLAAALTVVSAVSWRHYRRTRPVRLSVDAAGCMHCTLADATVLDVRTIRTGMVNPVLVTARLVGETGRSVDLFASSSALNPETHWRLRRVLLAWHADERQSGDWRGT
ncbi:MAG: hypothetical protein KDJ39_10215 [Gammaproteobacteria bacterium]|nr:hypothetical protein [Gammaproteobacteria bacterium]MCP5299608.1 hypothetical protein [Chromatiaceae bacterium]